MPIDPQWVNFILNRTRLTASKSSNRFRRALSIAAVGLALMLVIASALMVRTMRELTSLELGFDPTKVVSANLPGPQSFDEPARLAAVRAMESAVVEEVRALPGVIAAGIGMGPAPRWHEGRRSAGARQSEELRQYRRGLRWTGLFRGAGRPAGDGPISAADMAKPSGVVIVNESAARVFWPDGEPVGKTLIKFKVPLTVVGVVADMRGMTLEAEPGPRFYFLHVEDRNFFTGMLVARRKEIQEAFTPPIRTILRRVEPDHPFREWSHSRNESIPAR